MQIKNYKAYIAENKHSYAFDSATEKTAAAAIASVKRKNSPDWKDCCVWAVAVYENGQEDQID